MSENNVNQQENQEKPSSKNKLLKQAVGYAVRGVAWGSAAIITGVVTTPLATYTLFYSNPVIGPTLGVGMTSAGILSTYVFYKESKRSFKESASLLQEWKKVR